MELDQILIIFLWRIQNEGMDSLCFFGFLFNLVYCCYVIDVYIEEDFNDCNLSCFKFSLWSFKRFLYMFVFFLDYCV